MNNMSTAEQEILAYLDGTLDEGSKEELLHRLSVSPEKRALLESHLKLKEMVAMSQRSVPAPLAAQRALAERLPILAEKLPHLKPLGYVSEPVSEMAEEN